MLHWSTDPLLLDKEPMKANNWETANSLIEKGRITEIISPDLHFKNIYGIMVRKNDFVRKSSRDRIIARFPFLILTDEIRAKIQERTLLIAEVARDYFYRSINKSITAWRDIVLKYIERGALPFPLFRCAQEIIPELSLPVNGSGTIPFMSARGEAFTFPTKMSNQLAYLCGICNGDGNLREYWIIVADETKEHIEFVTQLLAKSFSKSGKLMKTGGAWIVKLNLLWSVRLFNFLTDQAIDEPKYDSLREPLVFQSSLGKTFRNDYWRGIMDSDGSYSKYNICLTTASKPLMVSFANFLEEKKIKYSTKENYYKEMDAYGYMVQILAASHIDFCLMLDSYYINKKKQLDAILRRKVIQHNKGQILHLKETSLTLDGYFDFNKLIDLRIILTPKLASDLYENINLALLEQKQSTHNRYKNGKLAIPLSIIKEIREETNQEDICSYIVQNEITQFYSGKSSAKLPLKPNKTLEEILLLLKIRKGYLYIDLSNIDISLKPIKIKIEETFAITIEDTELWNKVIYKFIKTFYKINSE